MAESLIRVGAHTITATDGRNSFPGAGQGWHFRCRPGPASVAVSNSSSVYDIPCLSRTGEPYRVPSTPTFTSHPRTRSAHTRAGA